MYIVFGALIRNNKRKSIDDKSVKEGKWFTGSEFLNMDDSLLVHSDMKLVYRNVIEGKGALLDTVKFIDYDKQ
jgi:hypothetical protein